MERTRPALAVLALAGLAACGREGAFADRTAQVTVDGRTTTYTVDGCVLDGQTAYVAAHHPDGGTVQAVIGVEADGTIGVPASTGISVVGGPDAPSVAAFGPEAWRRRGEDGIPPGSITSARIRGSRIQAGGEAAVVGPDERPSQPGTVALSFDARCDETGDR